LWSDCRFSTNAAAARNAAASFAALRTHVDVIAPDLPISLRIFVPMHAAPLVLRVARKGDRSVLAGATLSYTTKTDPRRRRGSGPPTSRLDREDGGKAKRMPMS
jgi:hypothetical protein